MRVGSTGQQTSCEMVDDALRATKEATIGRRIAKQDACPI